MLFLHIKMISFTWKYLRYQRELPHISLDSIDFEKSMAKMNGNFTSGSISGRALLHSIGEVHMH